MVVSEQGRIPNLFWSRLPCFALFFVILLWLIALVQTSDITLAQQGPPYVWTTPTVGYFTQNNLDIRANVFKIVMVNGVPQKQFQGTIIYEANVSFSPYPQYPSYVVYGYNSTNNWNSGTFVVHVQQYTPPNNITVLQNFQVGFP